MRGWKKSHMVLSEHNISKISDRRLFHIITAGRLLIFLLLLGAVWFKPPGSGFSDVGMQQLSMLLGAAFFFTTVFSLWHRRTGPDPILNTVQMCVDVALVSVTVLFTGGIQSGFSFLYVPAIVTACLLGGRVLGAMAVFLSTTGYAAVTFLTPGALQNIGYAAYIFLINMSAFNITAVLGIWLAQRVRHTEQELTDAAATVARMEKIQHHLAESMRSGLIMVDGAGTIIFCNRSSREILGPAMKHCRGLKLSDVWPEMKDLTSGSGDSEPVQRREIKFSGPDVQEKILGVSTFPVLDQDGRSLGYGIIFQDITEIIIKAEHLHRMDRLACLGEMAAGLAHEIRNPLASISGAAQFLAEGDLVAPEGRRLLDIIFRETNRLNRLTNSFLLYGRPARETVEQVNAAAEVEEIVELVGRRQNLPRAEVEIDIPESAVLETEPNQLRQILVNLILNAWQALPQQDGRITVSGRLQEGMLELKIADNGSGITPDDLDRIFNPFFTTKPDGTGLGLAIVQRLVHDLGGKVSAVSSPEHGTEFKIVLPLADESDEADVLLDRAA